MTDGEFNAHINALRWVVSLVRDEQLEHGDDGALDELVMHIEDRLGELYRAAGIVVEKQQ